MQWQRAGARIATMAALVAGLVAVGAAPALAADDTVEVRLPSEFTAGDSPSTISVSIDKRTDGCTRVQTALGFGLPGLPADQVKVEVRREGEWRDVDVTKAGNGLVVTEQTRPEKSYLCERRDTSIRYRVAFLKEAPSGQVTIVAEAYASGGRLMNRDTDTRTLINPDRPSPSASASAADAQQPPAPAATGPSVAAAAPAGQSADTDGSFFGLGTLVMLFGLAMVGCGVALLVILLRRNRAEPDEPGGSGFPGLPPYPPRPPSVPPASSAPRHSAASAPPTRSFDGNSDQTRILPKAID
jgi:hypothetical protein